MRRLIIALSCIVMLCNSLPSFGWGQMGHDVVAAIAENNLSKKTKKALDKILEGKSIIYYSSWMDNIQNSPDWDSEYKHTKTWHYANVDKGYTYQTMPKNEDGDVVTALNMLTKELTENIDNLTERQKADYVKMVIHLVGDLHCPMHAGRLSDRGGNGVKVKWFGQNTNLHSIFDSKMIDSARKWGYKEWVDQLDRKDKKFKKAAAQGTYEEWFMTTVESAAKIYDYVESSKKREPNLSYQFVYDFSPLLEEQLIMGGYRLAFVLNTIFE